MSENFTIDEKEHSIQCHGCHRISYNRNDVISRYCGACHVFHDYVKRCDYCGEIMHLNERAEVFGGDFHRECLLRSVVGSVGHQMGLCSCFVMGSSVEDPEGMTKRQAAKAAAAFFQRRDQERSNGNT